MKTEVRDSPACRNARSPRHRDEHGRAEPGGVPGVGAERARENEGTVRRVFRGAQYGLAGFECLCRTGARESSFKPFRRICTPTFLGASYLKLELASMCNCLTGKMLTPPYEA